MKTLLFLVLCLSQLFAQSMDKPNPQAPLADPMQRVL